MFRLIVFLTILWQVSTNGYEFSNDDALALKDHFIEKHFAKWCLSFGKEYLNGEERDYRYETFKKNLRVIRKLNKEYDEQGIAFEKNKFADLDPFEFAEKYLMPKRNPVKFPQRNFFVLSERERENLFLPESFDWNEKGAVTPIRDQGSAGTCWAFSAVQNIEGQWALKGKNLTEFSVEQIVDCDGTEDVSRGKADCGVFGGWPYLAYQYVQKAGGIETEMSYPYCCGLGGGKGTCYVCPAPGYNKTLCGPPSEYCQVSDSCHAKIDPSKFVEGLKVTGWSWFKKNETEIAKHLMNVGPLSVAMNAAMLQYYRSGVYDPSICDPTALDHAVLITGFGQEKTILGKTKEYWIVKNSWGKDWGEKGYFRIVRGKDKCGISTQVTTAHLD